MAFISEAVGLMVNNPLIYRIVLDLFEKIEFKRDLCLKVRHLYMYSNTPDRFMATLLWKFSVLENYETRLLKQLVQPGMHVVDIGANIGYYALLMADLTGRSGKVTAFEPDPDNYRLLKKNIGSNRIHNVTAVRKAISDQNGKARLFLNKGHRGDHRLSDPEGKRPFLEIETTTLDAYLSGDPVALLKMDIQGAELLAVQGMRATFSLNPGLKILTEFSPYHLARFGVNPSLLLESFISAGFDLKIIDEKHKAIRPIRKAALLDQCKGRRYANLFLTRKM